MKIKKHHNNLIEPTEKESRILTKLLSSIFIDADDSIDEYSDDPIIKEVDRMEEEILSDLNNTKKDSKKVTSRSNRRTSSIIATPPEPTYNINTKSSRNTSTNISTIHKSKDSGYYR